MRGTHYIRIRKSLVWWQVMICTGSGRPVTYLGRSLTHQGAIERADSYISYRKEEQ